MKSKSPIPSYINQFKGDIKKRLNVIYKIIGLQLPAATETFAYQMPTFKGKKNLIHFARYTKHIGVYPGPLGIQYLQTIMPTAITSKGAWQIPHSNSLPEKEINKLCQWIKINYE
jgi:uncharacterized protein YdhG (YjbR/CyaY superfamily)